MDLVERKLNIIANCIRTQTYQEVETEGFELKNLAGGWGDDWYKTVCAFLNTNGGIIVIGIQDKNNAKPPHYKFTGFENKDAQEKHLVDELPLKFTHKNGQAINLKNHLKHYEIRDFLDGRVAIIYVEELPDDQKYVFYNNIAYQRKLTGDHELSKAEIEEYEELKKDVIQAQELKIVDIAIETLNIDTLNEYIFKYNYGKRRGETIKSSLADAKSFLNRESFIRDNKPTLLGLLICGNNIEKYLLGRCEADCYVISEKAKTTYDKEVIIDNITSLIERCFNYVWRNIKVGIINTNGGTASPEYPESLIRESINNAFAHRNYQSERFVIIEVVPNEKLIIRNPGNFERRQRIHLDTKEGKIRKIIPIQVARNPKLAHILKTYNYWEGKGNGLHSLVDACLDNEIDVPYYTLKLDEIMLTIPQGKVFDESMELWIESFEGYINEKYGELSIDEKVLLSYFYKSEKLNRTEDYTILLTNDNNHKKVIADLEEKGLLFKNSESAEIYPIYQVDRTLVKKDFSQELINLFGVNNWKSLNKEIKEVLQLIYQYNFYAKTNETISANKIGSYLYFQKYSKFDSQHIKEFESFKRKIRAIFNKLEDNNFIVRKDGKTRQEGGKPDYIINKKLPKNLFN